MKTPVGYFYILSASKRLEVTPRCLHSWAPHRVIETSEEAVANYRLIGKMPFRNHSLLYSLANGRIYLIIQKKRYWVSDPDALVRIGSHPNDKNIQIVSKDEIDIHEYGGEFK